MIRINVKLYPKRCNPTVFGIMCSYNPGVSWERLGDHADNELVLICDDQVTDSALQSLLVELQSDEEVEPWNVESSKDDVP